VRICREYQEYDAEDTAAQYDRRIKWSGIGKSMRKMLSYDELSLHDLHVGKRDTSKRQVFMVPPA
jgi:hypothetical protein